MKNLAVLIFILIFSVAVPFGSFSEVTAITEWAPYSGVEGFTLKDNVLAFNSTSYMPLLITKDNILVNASRQKVLEIRMRSDKSYMTGRLFFRRIGDAGFNVNNSFQFQTGLNNMYHTYTINLGRNPNWFGTVAQLILSPISDTGSVELESVSFMEPSLSLAAKASWQEFMRFEPIMGVTVNTIKGETLNETPINFYIYFALLTIALIIIGKNFKQLRFDSLGSLYGSLNASFREIILMALILFTVLEARQGFDYCRQFMIDRSTLFGKPLDTKRDLTTYGGLYEYIQFVKAHIPERATATLTSTDPYFKEKGRYYLYPIRIVQEDPDYILVFRDPAKDAKGYRLLAKLSNDQMILVKGK